MLSEHYSQTKKLHALQIFSQPQIQLKFYFLAQIYSLAEACFVYNLPFSKLPLQRILTLYVINPNSFIIPYFFKFFIFVPSSLQTEGALG